jgi:hypothetical protein
VRAEEDGSDAFGGKLKMSQDTLSLDEAVDEAVQVAKDVYDDANKNPFGHGFAHIEVDGRTSLAHALKAHPDVDASDTSYITISGLTRYVRPQKSAYRAFRATLAENGIETDVVVKGRLD